MADYVKKHAKKNLNLFVFTGNIGKVQDMRYLPNGDTAVLNFSVAIANDYTKDDGTIVEKTVWVDFVAYGKRAEGLNKVIRKFKAVAGSGQLLAPHGWIDGDSVRASNKMQIEALECTVWKDTDSSAGGGEYEDDNVDDVPF